MSVAEFRRSGSRQGSGWLVAIFLSMLFGEEGYFIISPKVILLAQAVFAQNVRFNLVIELKAQGRLQNT